MTDIVTQADRLSKLSKLLLEMCKEYDFKKFMKMQEEFENEIELNKLEDEVNG